MNDQTYWKNWNKASLERLESSVRNGIQKNLCEYKTN